MTGHARCAPHPFPASRFVQHPSTLAKERLQLGPAWNDRDLVFCAGDGSGRAGGPINPSNLLVRQYYPLLQRARLPRIRFHDLRHTAATLLLEKNINVKVVSEMLGHSQVGITMDLYQHVTPTMQQEAADTGGRRHLRTASFRSFGGQFGGQVKRFRRRDDSARLMNSISVSKPS
jgi:hypothetical protein